MPKKLEKKPKVAVIGAGVIGLEISRQLTKQNSRVVIIAPEKDELIGSKAAMGVASVKGGNWPRQSLFTLKTIATSTYPQWLKLLEEESGIKIDLLRGATEISSQENYIPQFKRVWHRQFTGLGRIEMGDAKALPLAWHYPADVAASPEKIMTALEAIAAAKTERIYAKVNEICSNSEGQPKIVMENGATEVFDKIVVAAGIGMEALYSQEEAKRMEFTKAFGYTLKDSSKDDPELVLHGLHALTCFDQVKYYGSTSLKECSVDKIDKTAAMADIRDKYASLLKLLNRNFSSGKIDYLFGVRCLSKDRMPMIGPMYANNDRIFVCGAMYKNGFHIAHEAGKILLKRMAEPKISEPWLADFCPLRFAAT